ncbi:C4-dicarboxylate ABC transporter substrate-binding protein [Paractinoplanes deccanensis]|uniref:C4-dicarboxylate ABC transporter substrate-binding protein n=1 Tax=Paractinoplanes deccanensis TaxID=113561 RepID=A0ABQ3XXA5_9ACTN|nr:tripartite tricarboxylate transporter substrate binding protein [Actinoplanes deccanensis]GID72384.1 C4-dicarboxylate ABC transporter substrate-binding protein [Actinoplanes deccanensis]
MRRWGPWIAAALATVLLVVSAAWAEDDEGFLDGRQLRLMAPAAPGGGWDQTAREMQAALRDLAGRSEVYNVTGAGGTIGLSQFVRNDGDPTQLMVMGLIMLGAIESNDAPIGLDRTRPLVRLTTDYEVIVVPASSPVRTMPELVARMRQDLGAVSFAGGSAGGVEQILAGLVADAVGADPGQVNYVAHSGGGEALATLLSGRATAGVSGVSELAAQIEAGTVRPLAVSSATRLPALPDVPTLKEQGVDVELANWRGVVAPPGIGADDERALEELLLEMTRGAQWRETLQRRGWGDATLAGPEFEQFIDQERRTVTDVLKKMGLA